MFYSNFFNNSHHGIPSCLNVLRIFWNKVFSDLKNLTINKELKRYDNLTFLDYQNNQINLDDFKGNLVLLNFWATWCAPCKEEMPSLDKLQINKNLDNLKIFPINVGQENVEKTYKFFKDLKINNLDLYTPKLV